MSPRKPLTTRAPLTSLWSAHGRTDARRVRAVGPADASALVAAGSVQIVLSDAGQTLEWVTPERSEEFWIAEVVPRIIDPDRRTLPANLPGGYGYAITEWITDAGARVLLLERRR